MTAIQKGHLQAGFLHEAHSSLMVQLQLQPEAHVLPLSLCSHSACYAFVSRQALSV